MNSPHGVPCVTKILYQRLRHSLGAPSNFLKLDGQLHELSCTSQGEEAPDITFSVQTPSFLFCHKEKTALLLQEQRFAQRALLLIAEAMQLPLLYFPLSSHLTVIFGLFNYHIHCCQDHWYFSLHNISIHFLFSIPTASLRLPSCPLSETPRRSSYSWSLLIPFHLYQTTRLIHPKSWTVSGSPMPVKWNINSIL